MSIVPRTGPTHGVQPAAIATIYQLASIASFGFLNDLVLLG